MAIYFPTSRVDTITRTVRFAEWINQANPYHEVKVSLAIPHFLHLIAADHTYPNPDKPFVDLGYFKDENATAEVLIQASAMQHEVSLLDYYTLLVGLNDEKILQQRLITDNDQPDLLLTKTASDGEVWITRRTGYKVWMGAGAFVITLSMTCQQDSYSQLADVFFYMLSTFRPFYKPDYQFAERLVLFSKRYPLDFATYLPQSWQMAYTEQETMEEMKAGFTKQYRGQMIGFISLNTISDLHCQTPRQVANRYLNAYVDHGLNLPAIQLKKFDLENSSRELFCVNEAVNTEDDGQTYPYELTAYIERQKNAWLYIELISPTAGTDAEAVLINRRAVEIGINNLRIEKGKFNFRKGY